MHKNIGLVERSFINDTLNGDAMVQKTIAQAKQLTANELRLLGRAVNITAAMCSDGSDAASVVFAAKFSGGKRWSDFRGLVAAAAESKNCLNN